MKISRAGCRTTAGCVRSWVSLRRYRYQTLKNSTGKNITWGEMQQKKEGPGESTRPSSRGRDTFCNTIEKTSRPERAYSLLGAPGRGSPCLFCSPPGPCDSQQGCAPACDQSPK